MIPSRVVFGFLGALAGAGVPFSWLLWRAFDARRAWWLSWLKTEFHNNYGGYVAATVVAVGLFAVLGYLFGAEHDRLREESDEVKDHNLTLSEMAETDGLTGLLNVRSSHERLAIELEDSYRSHLTVLLIDIDHFKRINDRFGHPFGDQVLVETAAILKKSLRLIDSVGRLGGEEFIILLPRTPQEKGVITAERIRETLESHPFQCDGKPVTVTVSVGVATHTPAQLRGKESLMKAADDALYKAKRAGRNRVVVWNEAAE